MNMKRYFWIAWFALAVGSILNGRAHTVWIEPNTVQELTMRFAEPGDDFETSPGHLDGLSQPLVFRVATNAVAALGAAKIHDGFTLKAPRGAAVCAESTYTVRGGRKPIFYARWQAEMRTAKPMLTLDLVPTGKSGEVRAYFRGRPLGGAQAFLRTPDGEEQELVADDEGYLRFNSDQTGLHLLTVPHHREPLGGFHLGKPYDRTSHNAALTWIRP